MGEGELDGEEESREEEERKKRKLYDLGVQLRTAYDKIVY